MMKRSKLAKSLEGPFTRLARAMSRNYHVTVIPSGFACNTDGTDTIRIPFNADDLKDVHQRVLHGMLDHEIQHVVAEREAAEAKAKGFGVLTPNDVMKRASSDTERMFINVYEDIRIEMLAERQFIGVAENLRASNLHSVEVYRTRSMKHGLERANFWHTLGSAVIFKARGFGIEWVPAGIATYVALLDDEIEASRRTTSVEGSWALAKRTIEKIREAVEAAEREAEKRRKEREEAEAKKLEEERAAKAEDDADESSDDSDEAGDDGDEDEGGEEGDGEEGDEDGEASDDGDEEGEDSGEDGADGEEGDDEGASGGEADGDEEDSEEDSSEHAPAGGDESDEGEDSAKAEAAEGSTDESGEGDDSDAEGEDGGPFAGVSDEELAAACEAGEGADHDADVADLSEYVKAEIKDIAEIDAKTHRRYVPNPAAQARDRWITPIGDKTVYDRDRDTVNSQIHAMKAKLLTILRARAESHHVGDKERGALDPASLYSLRLGNKRVFSQRTKADTLNTAISIVVDMSGSMAGDKAQMARQMAIALGETFTALNIPFEVVGFHNTSLGAATRSKMYTRYYPFEFYKFKSFEERYNNTRYRLSAVAGLQQNVDGEAVLECARRLSYRAEERKIMFVLSDGEPMGGCDESDSQAHLVECVKRITASGIEVIGIGAMTKAVERFYKPAYGASNVVINDINQLAVEVYKLMRSRLLGGNRVAV